MIDRPSSRTRKLLLVPTALSVGVAAALLLAPAGASAAAAPPVTLGTAAAYSVLTGPSVSNTDPTTLAGNLGVSDTTGVVTGDADITVGGARHIGDDAAADAQAAADSAFTQAAGLTSTPLNAVELGGTEPAPGVYSHETLGLTGTLTLNAHNDPDAYWVFQAGTTLVAEVNSAVHLTGGADPCRVFWQVGSSATLKTDTAFVGTVLAHVAITVGQGADIDGRLLAKTAGITLDNDTITGPTCGPTGGGSTPVSSPASSAPSTGGTTTTAPPTTGSTTPAGPSTPVITAPVVTPPAGGTTPPVAGVLSTTSGSPSGGTLVTLTGKGFVPGHTSVTVGGTTVPASSVKVLSPTQLVFRTPAHAAGTVRVSVTTSAGTSRTGLTFTYTSVLTSTAVAGRTTTTLSSTGVPVTLLAEVAALLLLAGTAALAFTWQRSTAGRHRS